MLGLMLTSKTEAIWAEIVAVLIAINIEVAI